jgi:predicted nucleotidyltransferase
MSVTAREMLETLRRRSSDARRVTAARTEVVRRDVVVIVRRGLPAKGRAWLIGSLAWGSFGERSDVDLVFDGVGDDRLTEIEIAIARATACPVDVLQLRELPASFQARVEREGLPLHGP